MDELIKTFHIDWKLLIAQIVNFAIVLGVLWYFALKPLMKIMNKRSQDIEKSLKDAKEIEKKLAEADQTKEKTILEAKQEALIIMEKIAKEAKKLREGELLETRKEMEKLTEKTKADLLTEKEKMVQEAKQEVGNLVVEASSKIVGKNLDNEANKKLIQETVKQVKK